LFKGHLHNANFPSSSRNGVRFDKRFLSQPMHRSGWERHGHMV
jgi:hypothetical protein